MLRPFIRYLQQFDPATQVPPPKLLGSTHRRPAPHIYSDEEIEALLAAAGQLRPSGGLRPSTYETLFGLLAATGMRISEALRLERADVLLEHGMLVVRQSKYRNYAAFVAMPIKPGLDHDDACKEPAGGRSQVARIGIVLMAIDP